MIVFIDELYLFIEEISAKLFFFDVFNF